MPCLTSQSSDLQKFGPIIPVFILPSASFIKTIKEKQPGDLEKYTKGYRAQMLIDTGASCTVIDKNIPKILNLKHHGMVKISTPSSNSHDTLTYDIDLILIQNQYHASNIQVVEGDLKTQGLDGLIGRDILKNVLFLYHGYTNQFTLAI